MNRMPNMGTIKLVVGMLALLSLLPAIYLLPIQSRKQVVKAADTSTREPLRHGETDPIPIIILWLTGVTTVGLGRTMLRRLRVGEQVIVNQAPCKRVVLLGAGPQAEYIIKGIYEDPQLRYDIIGILDNRQAQGTHVHNVRVIGPCRHDPPIAC